MDVKMGTGRSNRVILLVVANLLTCVYVAPQGNPKKPSRKFSSVYGRKSSIKTKCLFHPETTWHQFAHDTDIFPMFMSQRESQGCPTSGLKQGLHNRNGYTEIGVTWQF